MRIITIGREFGSGGREVGKRLAEALGVPCYDKEIIYEVAKLNGVSPERVESISESDITRVYPLTIGSSIMSNAYYNNSNMQIHISEAEIIKRLASQGDCVVVGRSSDVILKKYKPLRIFVYASKQSKLERCLKYKKENETEKTILKQMKKIDNNRKLNRRLMTDKVWGEKETYDLMINTSHIEIKTVIPALKEFVDHWFSDNISEKY